jgi:hypothetical protein
MVSGAGRPMHIGAPRPARHCSRRPLTVRPLPTPRLQMILLYVSGADAADDASGRQGEGMV